MKNNFFTLLFIVVLWHAGMVLGSQNNVHRDAEQVLGVKEGTPISNGFVFVDGKYIEPPYVVSRRGNEVFINGYLVDTPCPWPIPEDLKMAVTEKDPEMPVTITKSSSQYDHDVISYLANKSSFIAQEYDDNEVAREMLQVYRELPCIKNASEGRDPEHIKITWRDGTTVEQRVTYPKRQTTKWTKEKLVSQTERTRAQYAERLNKGDFYILGESCNRITGNADGARMLLGSLVPVLSTSKNATEVEERMKQAGFVFDLNTSTAFFSHNADLKDLEKRVEKLTERKE